MGSAVFRVATKFYFGSQRKEMKNGTKIRSDETRLRIIREIKIKDLYPLHPYTMRK